MMGLLITGASGYVGSHLIQILSDAEKRVLLTPSHSELDIADYSSVKKYFEEHAVDQVVHLAACLNNSNSASLFQTNIVGTFNLLSACVENNIEHVLVASTNNVYGSKKQVAYTETDLGDPMLGNYYGLSKYCSDLLVTDYLKNHSIKHVVVRIADIYGPAQKEGALLKAIVSNIKNKLPQKLYGTGDRTRDYIYIDDVAAGIAFAVRNKLEGIYNLSTGIGTSVCELISLAEKLSPCNEPTVHITVEKEDHSKIVLNNTKLREAGFAPKITIAEGLKSLAEYGGVEK